MKVNNILKSNKIFMFSSVHNWMDTRIFNKEATSLAESGKIVDFYAIGNEKKSVIHDRINLHLLSEKGKFYRPLKWRYLLKKALISDAKFYHFHDSELLYLAKKIRKAKPEAIIIYDMHEYFSGQLSTKEWIPVIIRNPTVHIAKKLEKKMDDFL